MDTPPKAPRVVAIVQARNGSSRFPRKSFADLAGKPLLARVIERLRAARRVDDVCVATTRLAEDEEIVAYAARLGVKTFAGDVDDVQKRFLDAARNLNADAIVRICGDSPFVDPEMIDRLVAAVAEEGADYAEPDPADPGAYEGQEAVRVSALERARALGDTGPDREHVTRYIRTHETAFRVAHPAPPDDARGRFRLSVDNLADLEFARAVYHALGGGGRIFAARELAAFLRAHPEIVALNAHVRQKDMAAPDRRLAFVVEDIDALGDACAIARRYVEHHHCGVAMVGPFSEDDLRELADAGFRRAALDVATADGAALAAAVAKSGARAALAAPGEAARRLAAAGVPVFDFGAPEDAVLAAASPPAP